MKILAFDLAGKTGWARLDEDGSVESGTSELALRDDEHPGARSKRAREYFTRKVAALGDMIDLLAWEKVIANSGPFASSTLFVLEAQLVEVAFDFGVPTKTVAPNTLKKFATGNGRADKKQVLASARERWPDVDFATHDQADAMFVLAWAEKQLAECGT